MKGCRHPPRRRAPPGASRVPVPRARRLPQTEDLHRGAQQGGEQVPASLLQPIEEQHGWSEATEEAEDEKSYPVNQFLANLIYKNIQT